MQTARIPLMTVPIPPIRRCIEQLNLNLALTTDVAVQACEDSVNDDYLAIDQLTCDDVRAWSAH